MLLADVVAASAAMAATRSRLAKTAAVADLLGRAEDEEVGLVALYLSGALRQRRTGLGWRTVAEVRADPAAEAQLTVEEVDAAFAAMEELSGAGSQTARRDAWSALLGAATAPEQAWLRAVATGEVRQGASDALLLDAVAQVTGVEPGLVRRAAMLAGSSVTVVETAVREGETGLRAVGLEVGRPLRPMLAAGEPEVPAALARLQQQEPGPHAVETKLDGIRVQVHRDGDEVRVWTRSLDEVTERLPGVVAAVRGLASTRLVLDGEALLLDESTGRAKAFQDTASGHAELVPRFFDLLHADGADLLDSPARDRWAALERHVPDDLRVERLLTDDPEEAAAYATAAVAAGHEGVVLKAAGAPYAAGRRGAGWIKVKPRLTVDLVVLAVEWGSGRRRGLLSNIHLGARGADGGLVMVGKTFKGMTDEMLAWQTERFLGLETHRDGHVVHVRSEQVVEIAFDGVQRSTRYPGGVALRFARVVRYRDDKAPAEADGIDTLRALL